MLSILRCRYDRPSSILVCGILVRGYIYIVNLILCLDENCYYNNINFVKLLKDIQDGLFKRNKFPGCYVYSRLKHDITFKLGMSEKDLFDRVKKAKFCFLEKDTFFIYRLPRQTKEATC